MSAQPVRSSPHIAIVGAGMAGLSCAQALAGAGMRVRLFDKGRGPGGRMSTRRSNDWQCDHGAQYFTARDPAFRAEVARWQAAGAAALWKAEVRRFDAGDAGACGELERFVGTPRMSAPARLLATTLALDTGIAIDALTRDAGGWRLHASGPGVLDERYDAVVLALPAPQAEVLLRAPAPAQAALARAANMRPCWVLMLEYRAPPALGFDAAFVNQGPLRWIARDSAKPGRAGSESWVLHASADWSEAYLESDPQEVGAALLAAFAQLGGPAPEHWRAHRWRYASTEAASSLECSWDAGLGIGLCGDWLNGGTVEAAWLSGRALARRIAGIA